MFAADLAGRRVASNLAKRRANVESLRIQSKKSLRRVVVIKAFIAVRLLQLKEIAQNREEEKIISYKILLS